MIVIGLLISVFYLQKSSATIDEAEASLLLAQVVHRHGDRTPTKAWGPNDPNPESVWPQGWGQLTTDGMKQLFYLGQSLRKRYRGFLSDDYVNSEVYVRSSGVERALMSAQCNLAGLFPPKGNRKWSARLPWQPIPIHSSPVQKDWVMRSTKVCPVTYQKLKDSYLKDSPRVSEFINKHLQLIDDVTKAAGLYKADEPLENLLNAWRIGGNLHIVRRHNKTLPSWATDSTIDSLYNLRAEKHGIQSQATPQIKRIQGGPFLGKIVQNFIKFGNGTLEPEDHTSTANSSLKLLLFSGHDTNLAALLGILGLYDPPWMLEYGTALIFELHTDGKRMRRNGEKEEDGWVKVISASKRRSRRRERSRRDDGGATQNLSPENLIVKTFLMEGIHNNSAATRRLQIPGCDGGGGGGGGGGCRLSKLKETFNDVAVWSEKEFLQLCHDDDKDVCNGGIRRRNSYFVGISGLAVVYGVVFIFRSEFR